MKKLLILLTILIVAGFSLNSCLKEPKAPAPGYDVTETGTNSTQLIEAPLDVFLQADRAIRLQRDSIVARNINQSTFSFKIGYINFTVSPADTVTFPKTVTVDFGTDTSKSYTGKMILKLNGKMRTTGSYCAITYVNLITGKSLIKGTDSIISSGISNGNVVTRYNMHGGQLVGYGNKNISYSGRVISKFNLSTGTNVLDSVEINATDANQWVYSIPVMKLQVTSDCNYFNAGTIYSDIKINNVLTGYMAFDFSTDYYGNTNYLCDAYGAIWAYSKLNNNYKGLFMFYAKKFQ
jgi:hypothetical protein